MALTKHEEDDSSNRQKNQAQYPSSSTDKAFSGNDEHELLNDENIQEGKEKYIRESANIEDVRGNGGEPVQENSTHLTDESGEEKKEEYINTDERKKDLDQNGGYRDL
jgi:hypothetical protein